MSESNYEKGRLHFKPNTLNFGFAASVVGGNDFFKAEPRSWSRSLVDQAAPSFSQPQLQKL
jgi:hypothetical protein